MKILYAIQGTGNGHLSRAMEIAPLLMERAEVDMMISGKAADLKFPYQFEYTYHGLFFVFGTNGGIDIGSSIRQLRPVRLVLDILQCPVKKYDLVISDFEPISAWASWLKNVPSIALSHQASFISDKVPRAKRKNRIIEYAMRLMASCKYNIGLHYRPYDKEIYYPVIRKELKKEAARNAGHVCVYLPAFGDDILKKHFKKLGHIKWYIFSKNSKHVHKDENVEVFPVDRKLYTEKLLSAHAVVVGAGFQGTSEALYLKKKLLTIPMYDQYEQLCNAAALLQLGVQVVHQIDDTFAERLRKWLSSDNKVKYSFESDTQRLVDRIFELVEI